MKPLHDRVCLVDEATPWQGVSCWWSHSIKGCVLLMKPLHDRVCLVDEATPSKGVFCWWSHSPFSNLESPVLQTEVSQCLPHGLTLSTHLQCLQETQGSQVVSILDGRSKFNQAFIQGVGDGFHSALHQDLRPAITPFQSSHLALCGENHFCVEWSEDESQCALILLGIEYGSPVGSCIAV